MINEVFKNLSDQEVRQGVLEILTDDERNDGIIESKMVRKLSKSVGEINHQPPSVNLLLVTISLLKEGCVRFIKNN
jgi:hypothetical protein